MLFAQWSDSPADRLRLEHGRVTLRAPSTKAFQWEPSMRLCSVASISGSVLPRPILRPFSRAAITLLSLTTRQSPGCRSSGRSRI